MGVLLGAAAIGGGLGLLSAGASLGGQALAYKYAKRMYRHRYQWAATDMAKAGLNRILAATQGAGAASAVGPQAQLSGLGETISRGAKAPGEMSLLKAQKDEALSRTRLNQSNAVRVNQETLLTHTRNELLKAGIPAAQAEEAFDRTSAGEGLRKVKRIKDAFNPFNPKSGGK